MNRPNILFLLSDEHGFRWLGHRPDSAGGEPVLTPNLDRLAGGGTSFASAYCQMPLCTPSRLSLLTGLEPRACGAWGNESVLRPELPTIASVLGQAGYRTGLIGKMHLGGTAQYAGFHDRPYGDLTGKTGHQWEPIGDPERHTMRVRTTSAGVTGIPESLLQDQVTAQETVAWIREAQASGTGALGTPSTGASNGEGSPWFALASFSRPHFPLTAPRRWIDHYTRTGVRPPAVSAGGDAWDHPMSVGMRRGFQADAMDAAETERARIGYAACVSYLDEVIGDLIARLDATGALDNTVIVYTSDHGEMAGEHGVWWKNGWYEACTRVPLIVSTPEQRLRGEPVDCDTPVGLLDLMPTLCSLAGVDPPARTDGRDLSPALDGAALPEVPVTCDALTPRWGEGTEFRSVRLGRYKYVRFRNAPPLAFDLEADPGEQRNLLAGATAPPDALAELARYAESSIDFDEAERERRERDGDLKERYALDLPACSGNLYVFPNAELVDADGPMLYERRVVAEDVEEVFERG